MNISEVIDELPFLELIVHFDELSGEQFERLKTLRDSKKLISFDQLLVWCFSYFSDVTYIICDVAEILHLISIFFVLIRKKERTTFTRQT